MTPRVVLKPKHAQPFYARHPWVFAGAIDRAGIVSDDFPPGSEVATHYSPCEVPHGCAGRDWTAYDPTQARELLAAAGLPDGFTTKLYYSATPMEA